MKIVQVMPTFGLAGAEIMCENLTYELRRMGHSVTVISMYDYHSAITERMENAGVDVRYLGKKRGLDLSMIGKIKKIMKQVGADVVHTHLNCAQYAIPAAMLAGVERRVHTVHNVAQQENRKAARRLNKFFFKHCHLTPVALSSRIQETLVEEYGLKKQDVPVIFNGIDLSKCMPKTDYESNGNFKILHIGRFSAQKNHPGLLEAFRLFHQKHPDSELWLIGDGEGMTAAQAFVEQNGLADSVKFLGLQSNVYPYLHDADMFTLPSLYEGIPMTIIEAMGTGLPIVATAVGGVPDMLDDSCAQLTDVDSGQLAAAFEKYYSDAALRERHGQAAKVRAEMFSAKKMAEEYTRIYADEINRKEIIS